MSNPDSLVQPDSAFPGAVPTQPSEHPDALDPIYQQAIEQFLRLSEDVRNTGEDASVASLATAGRSARPSVRTVNVARISLDGFLVFADWMSGKGLQMQDNPYAALCFYWPGLHHQVIVEGEVAMLSETASNEAWGQQQRISGLAHWASDQTGKPEIQQGLNLRLGDFKRRFSFEKVPRPPDWCGFLIRPQRIEFWKTGWGRLNVRHRYHRSQEGVWILEQANP